MRNKHFITCLGFAIVSLLFVYAFVFRQKQAPSGVEIGGRNVPLISLQRQWEDRMGNSLCINYQLAIVAVVDAEYIRKFGMHSIAIVQNSDQAWVCFVRDDAANSPDLPPAPTIKMPGKQQHVLALSVSGVHEQEMSMSQWKIVLHTISERLSNSRADMIDNIFDLLPNTSAESSSSLNIAGF